MGRINYGFGIPPSGVKSLGNGRPDLPGLILAFRHNGLLGLVAQSATLTAVEYSEVSPITMRASLPSLAAV